MRLYYKEIYLKDNPCTQPRKGWPHLRGLRPILFPNCGVGFFYVPQFSSLSLKSRKSNSFADAFTKAVLSSQLLKDPECWSSRGLNPRSPN